MIAGTCHARVYSNAYWRVVLTARKCVRRRCEIRHTWVEPKKGARGTTLLCALLNDRDNSSVEVYAGVLRRTRRCGDHAHARNSKWVELRTSVISPQQSLEVHTACVRPSDVSWYRRSPMPCSAVLKRGVPASKGADASPLESGSSVDSSTTAAYPGCCLDAMVSVPSPRFHAPHETRRAEPPATVPAGDVSSTCS